MPTSPEAIAQAKAELRAIPKLLLVRDYDRAIERVLAILQALDPAPLDVVIRGRRLCAAALRSRRSGDDLDRAVKVLDRALELSKHHEHVQTAVWLDLARTLAAKGDPDAERAFEQTLKPKASPLTVARADQEHARVRAARYGGEDKYVARMTASARKGFLDECGAEHPFVDGVTLFGHGVGLAEATHLLDELEERLGRLTQKDGLPLTSFSEAMACVRVNSFARAEDSLRVLCRPEVEESPASKRSAPWHLFTALLSAQGRFEEADAAWERLESPAHRLLRALGGPKR